MAGLPFQFDHSRGDSEALATLCVCRGFALWICVCGRADDDAAKTVDHHPRNPLPEILATASCGVNLWLCIGLPRLSSRVTLVTVSRASSWDEIATDRSTARGGSV